jgi:hypothetical protein
MLITPHTSTQGMRDILPVIRSLGSCPSFLGKKVDIHCDQTYDAVAARLTYRHKARAFLPVDADNRRHSGKLHALLFEYL